MLGFGFIEIIAVILFLIAGFISAEVDSAFASAFTFIGGFALLEFVLKISVFSVIAANPLWAVGMLVFYVGIGAAYTGIWRWPEFIRKNQEKIMSAYQQWSMQRGSNQDNSFDAFLESSAYDFNASDHKERLGTWVGLWPFSLTWEVSRKPAIWVWNNAYKSLGRVFQRISHNTARKIHDNKK